MKSTIDRGTRAPAHANADNTNITDRCVRDALGNRVNLHRNTEGVPRPGARVPTAARVRSAVPTSRATRKPRSTPAGRFLTIASLAFAVLCLAALTLVLLRFPVNTPPASGLPEARLDHVWSDVQVRANGRGEILEVSGPTPQAVLRAYCAPWPAAQRCSPLEIRSGSAELAGMRLGILRDTGRDATRAIQIVRAEGGQRWFAGGGDEPITASLASESTAGAMSVPIRALE